MSAWDHSTKDLIGHLKTTMRSSGGVKLSHEIGQAVVLKLERLQALEERRVNDPSAWAEDDSYL